MDQKNNIKISFIATAYKVSKYLPDFFDSFNKIKSLIDYEIILVNDNPEEVLNKEMWNGLNVKLINNKQNKGIGFSRNHGLENLSSETTNIFFIDPDDRISSGDFILKIIKNHEEIINFKYNDWTKKGIRHNPTWAGLGKYNLDNHLWGCSFPIKVKNDLFFREGEADDQPIKIRVSNKYRVLKSDIYAIDYRLRKSSISKSAPSPAKAKADVVSCINLFKEGAADKSILGKAFFELTINKKIIDKESYRNMRKFILENIKPKMRMIFEANMYRIVKWSWWSNLIKVIRYGGMYE